MYRDSWWSILVVSVGQNGPVVGSACVSWRGCENKMILFMTFSGFKAKMNMMCFE